MFTVPVGRKNRKSGPDWRATWRSCIRFTSRKSTVDRILSLILVSALRCGGTILDYFPDNTVVRHG